MLEPQSTVLFVLLVVAFGALVWWMLVARHVALRILAAFLAFIPAMTFGIAVVNKYYDYYQSWSAAVSDLTSQGAPATTVSASANGLATGFNALSGHHIDTAIARQFGLTLRLTVHGATSGITRRVYVFLPPQYFWAGYYQKYRFPVIELLHGFPGQPQDWITVIGINTTLKTLVAAGKAAPAVLVMPDANGSRAVSLQCLNQVRGPRDATYLAEDLPDYISRVLRVQPPGHAWGIAGYSEGGFCAANLGLQYGSRFGYAGVLSGYFKPQDNQLGHPARRVSPFGRNLTLRHRNTPVDLVESLPPGAPVPQFWLGAGTSNRSDTKNAEIFGQLVQSRQPVVTLKFVPGGGHTMFTWRALITPMLEWMTPRVTTEARLADQRAARRAHRHAAHPVRSAGPGHQVRSKAPGQATVPAKLAVPANPVVAKKHRRRR